MEYVMSQLFNGIVLGLLYVLVALGLTLILGVMEVINFVHAVLFTFGAYFSMERCQRRGVEVGTGGAHQVLLVIQASEEARAHGG